ncbi:MAG: hypothetical protein K2R98_13240 [Gemmataceae bacterium]|nr:hypothetical protein [Gemmataceae bacterium]
MRFVHWPIVLPVIVILSLTTVALSADKPAPETPQEAAKSRARLMNLAYLEGQLVVVDTDEKRFLIQVTDTAKVVNPQMQTKLAELTQSYQVALTKRNNAAQIASLAKQITDTNAKLYDTKEHKYDFDLKGGEKLNVRNLKLPPKDDGTKYTMAEELKLRGNSNLPGYAAEIAELSKGRWVRAYLDRNKLGGKAKEDDALSVVTLVIIPPKEEKPAPKK